MIERAIASAARVDLDPVRGERLGGDGDGVGPVLRPHGDEIDVTRRVARLDGRDAA